ncbi:MAG: PDZ domain-containing protein, partial [Planctomycetota bacterium]
MKRFPARALVALALVGGTCALVAWRLAGSRDPGVSEVPDGTVPPGRRDELRPDGPAVPGPGGPAARSPGRAPKPLGETPSSQPARSDGRIQLGPRVGADAWIEAEIRNINRTAWRVYLAYASERDCLYVDRTTGGAIVLTEVRGGTRRSLGKAARREPGGKTETLTARGRDGRWSVWLGGARVLSGESKPPAGARAGFSAVEGASSLARLSVRTPGDPAFFDEFMREEPDEPWRALSGRWELAGVHFAERSANPFALRARFPTEETPDPFLELRPKKQTPGVGVHFSSWRGVVNIERITGGGPASEAGVREHDIVLAIDSQPYLSVDAFSFFEDLDDRPPGTKVKLTLLRPGELRTRDVTLTSRVYRWGRARLGKAIAGSAAPGPKTVSALAVAGESFWDGYRYEASMMIPAHGGAGLAFAVRDRGNHHLLRAVGDAGGTGLASNHLALVR